MVSLPTVDELYLRSQEKVSQLETEVEELKKKVLAREERLSYNAQEYEESIEYKNRLVDTWKDMYFFIENNLTLAEEEIRRLKKKIRKLKK